MWILIVVLFALCLYKIIDATRYVEVKFIQRDAIAITIRHFVLLITETWKAEKDQLLLTFRTINHS